ncbi:MAG: OmpA family protein [Pseudomonadota bacterium]
MNTLKVIIAGAAMAALAGCGQSADDAAPDEAAADPTPSPEEPVSILRPDVEQPEEEAATLLEPLNTVIGFPDSEAELDADAVAALEAVLESEQLATGAGVTLRGHSDTGGSDASNLRASQMRAEAVRDWLIDQGVAEDRIVIIAFGEQNPVQPNALPDGTPNEAGRAANRRVEVLIVPPKGTLAAKPAPETPEEPSPETGD